MHAGKDAEGDARGRREPEGISASRRCGLLRFGGNQLRARSDRVRGACARDLVAEGHRWKGGLGATRTVLADCRCGRIIGCRHRGAQKEELRLTRALLVVCVPRRQLLR